MDTYFAEIWLITGIIFIVIEFSTIPGIGFLFLALGALTTSALVSFYSYFFSYQIATFGIASFLWFLILWWPLKKFVYGRKKINKKNHFKLIGSQVIVSSEHIKPGEIGTVSWSGTIMNARLADLEEREAKAGELLYISEIQGNILICSRKIISHIA